MITTKQRAYLRGVANGINAILQIGKEGVTDALVANIAEALEAREIVKVAVLETSPVSAKEAIADVMEKIPGTGAVQVMGRRFTVYKRNLKEPKIILP